MHTREGNRHSEQRREFIGVWRLVMRWCIQSTKEGERDPLPNVDVLLFVETSDVRSLALSSIWGLLRVLLQDVVGCV